MKAKRKETILMYVYTDGSKEYYEAVGKDNDSLTRTLNNNVESKENVLGETTVEVTKGPNVTTVDPIYYTTESKLANFLKSIYLEDKELDEVVTDFMEVDATGEATSGEYPAFKQKGAIDLKSYGGDTKGISEPFDINWCGSKIYGTFNPKTKTFTETQDV